MKRCRFDVENGAIFVLYVPLDGDDDIGVLGRAD